MTFEIPLDRSALVLEMAEAQTLMGDVRDALLTHLRTMRVPWAMLAEDEQQAAIDAVQQTAEHAVRTVAGMIAHQGAPHLSARVMKWTVKDNVKIELAVTGLVDNIVALAEHGATSAVLVLSDPADFMGERSDAKADKDQPDLPNIEGKAA